jgi:hypothetical protein
VHEATLEFPPPVTVGHGAGKADQLLVLAAEDARARGHDLATDCDYVVLAVRRRASIST